MRLVLIIFLSTFILACGSKRDDSGVLKGESTDTLAVDSFGVMADKIAWFVDTSRCILDYRKKSTLFLSRYNYEAIEHSALIAAIKNIDNYSWNKWEFVKNSKGKLWFFFTQYQSSADCYIAYKGLLNFFPSEGIVIKKGEYVKNTKILPLVIIVNPYSMTIVGFSCFYNKEDIKSIREELVKSFSCTRSKIITSSCGRDIRWIRF